MSGICCLLPLFFPSRTKQNNLTRRLLSSVPATSRYLCAPFGIWQRWVYSGSETCSLSFRATWAWWKKIAWLETSRGSQDLKIRGTKKKKSRTTNTDCVVIVITGPARLWKCHCLLHHDDENNKQAENQMWDLICGRKTNPIVNRRRTRDGASAVSTSLVVIRHLEWFTDHKTSGEAPSTGVKQACCRRHNRFQLSSVFWTEGRKLQPSLREDKQGLVSINTPKLKAPGPFYCCWCFKTDYCLIVFYIGDEHGSNL